MVRYDYHLVVIICSLLYYRRPVAMSEEDDSWIYDSVVGFLNSPIWMVPIESFVDQHCLGMIMIYGISFVRLKSSGYCISTNMINPFFSIF